jgi:phosphoribosylformylglycinamidine synthase
MAVSAIDEAVRNVVSVGADPDRISILDNFCWGNPLLPDRMGSLVRACKGCYDGAMQYGTPFVSGKDSLNNEYTDGATGQQVAIPPSLLISAMGIVPDVRQTCTMELKTPGNLLYLVGATRKELGGSYYYRLRGAQDGSVPGVASEGLASARALHRAISMGQVRACHDCSEGGIAVALAEMALGGRLGAILWLERVPLDADDATTDDWVLFSESNGRYLVEITPDQAAEFEAQMQGAPVAQVGQVLQEPWVRIVSHGGEQELFSLSISQIENAWRGHLKHGEGRHD